MLCPASSTSSGSCSGLNVLSAPHMELYPLMRELFRECFNSLAYKNPSDSVIDVCKSEATAKAEWDEAGEGSQGWDPRGLLWAQRDPVIRTSSFLPGWALRLHSHCILFLRAQSHSSVFLGSVRPFPVGWKERHWGSGPKFPISNVTSVLHHFDFVQDIPLLISPPTLTVAGWWGLKQLHLYSILNVKSCYITKCYYLGVCCSAADLGVSSWDVGRAQNPWGNGTGCAALLVSHCLGKRAP